MAGLVIVIPIKGKISACLPQPSRLSGNANFFLLPKFDSNVPPMSPMDEAHSCFMLK